MRHVVGADTDYLFVLSGGEIASIDEDAMDLRRIRDEMVRNGPRWTDVLPHHLDPEAVVIRHRDDGSESHAPAGTRLHQALQHGTDHRSQICTALTTLGIEPPEIDVWAYAESRGALVVVEAPAAAATPNA